MDKLSGSANELINSINTFKNEVDGKFNTLNESLSEMIHRSNEINAIVNQFKKDMIRSDASQIAKENLLRVDQIIHDKYDNYAIIRQHVLEIVISYDISLCENKNKDQLLEELWLNNSNYWLSYVLISLHAWVNDYSLIAENAMLESMRHDEQKTTLFYCLMNSRFNRMEPTKKWFYEHVKTIDHYAIPEYSFNVLKTYVKGAFGNTKYKKDIDFRRKVDKVITDLVNYTTKNNQIKNDYIEQYTQFIVSLDYKTEIEFVKIQKFCRQIDVLNRSLVDLAILNSIEYYIESLDKNIPKYYKEEDEVLLASMLKDIISKEDVEEMDIRFQQKHFLKIVEEKSNVNLLDTQAIPLENEKKYNLVDELVRFTTGDENCNYALKKYGLKCTKELFQTAVSNWYENKISKHLDSYYFNIRGFETRIAGADFDEQNILLIKHYKRNVNGTKYFNITNLLFLTALIATAFFSTMNIYALIGCFVEFVLIISAINKKGKKIHTNLDIDQKILKACVFEITEFKNFSDKAKAKYEVIQQKLDEM